MKYLSFIAILCFSMSVFADAHKFVCKERTTNSELVIELNFNEQNIYTYGLVKENGDVTQFNTPIVATWVGDSFSYFSSFDTYSDTYQLSFSGNVFLPQNSGKFTVAVLESYFMGPRDIRCIYR